MKSKFLMFVPGLLLIACSAAPPENRNGQQETAEANVAVVEPADNEASSSLYLSDMVDSADTKVDDDKVDDSVKDDVKAERLKAAAERMLAQLDKDGNKQLSEAEYLAILAVAGDKCKALTPEKLAEVQAKFKADFLAAAGADGSLSLEEIQVALKAQAIRIGKFRGLHKGQQSERKKLKVEELIAKYDKDGDKKLSLAELEAMYADLKNLGGADHKGGKGHDHDKGGDDKGKDKDKDKSKDTGDKSKDKDKDKDSKAPGGDGSVIVIPKP